MPDRPVIGITAGERVATYGVWKENAALVPADYVHAVAEAGGVPVLLSPVEGIAESLVGRIDGLMLTGGNDVDPSLFGAPAHPEAQRPDPARDRFELALLDAATARDLPVLAICRGIQVVNVWRGGTLHQHLPDVGADPSHLATPGRYGSHAVRVEPGSRLAGILGRERLEVPTHHHQAPNRVGDGLRAVAWADDGTIEGLEDQGSRYLVAVQWHPEMGDDPTLFESLVTAARPGPAG